MSEPKFDPHNLAAEPTISNATEELTQPDKEITPLEKREPVKCFEVSAVATEAATHHENQDRGATFEVANGKIVVVCDGVSTSADPAMAADLFIGECAKKFAAQGENPIPASQPKEFFYFHDLSTKQDDRHIQAGVFELQLQYLFFQELFQKAHRKIANRSPGSATASLVAFLEDNPPRATIYWLGDVRGYRYSAAKKSMELLTVDDNLMTLFSLHKNKKLEDVKAGMAQDDNAESPFKNLQDRFAELDPMFKTMNTRPDTLSRVVGKVYDGEQNVMPNATQILLEPGDKLYFVSDGFETLRPEEMARCETGDDLLAAVEVKKTSLRFKDDDRTGVVAKVV